VSSRTKIAIVFFAASIFSSCGTNDRSKSGQARVSYNCAANAVEIRRLQEELPSFADSTGVDIVLQPFTGQEKLYAMIAAGQPPDIFYTNNVLRDRLAAEGRLLDMRSLSEADPFVARLWPDVYNQGFSADSGLYSIGNWNFTAGVYFNKDLFDKAGLRYPDTSWTWDDLLSAARRIRGQQSTHGEPEHYGIFIPSHFVEIFELMNGAPVQERSLFLNISEPSLEVYRQYLALMNDGLMPDLRRMQAMGMQASQLLQTGKVAMLVEAVPHQVLSLRERRIVDQLPDLEPSSRVESAQVDHLRRIDLSTQSGPERCGFRQRMGRAVSTPCWERIPGSMAAESQVSWG